MLPKAHVLKAWSLGYKEVEPHGRKLSHWKCVLEGDNGTLPPCPLLPGCHELKAGALQVRQGRTGNLCRCIDEQGVNPAGVALEVVNSTLKAGS